MEPDRQSAVAEHDAGESLGRAWHDIKVACAGSYGLWLRRIALRDSELSEATNRRQFPCSDRSSKSRKLIANALENAGKFARLPR
jgi:hypothetical protein